MASRQKLSSFICQFNTLRCLSSTDINSLNFERILCLNTSIDSPEHGLQNVFWIQLDTIERSAVNWTEIEERRKMALSSRMQICGLAPRPVATDTEKLLESRPWSLDSLNSLGKFSTFPLDGSSHVTFQMNFNSLNCGMNCWWSRPMNSLKNDPTCSLAGRPTGGSFEY